MLPARLAVLLLLCAQNSLYTLLRRYSRGVLKETVSSAAVLLASEALKFILAACLVEDVDELGLRENHGMTGRVRDKLGAISNALRNGRPMAVPAIVYLIMNMLSFKAIELVDATVFAMIAQLKVLSTAVCTRQVLGRQLSTAQWRAIMLLTLSVVIITYQRGTAATRCADAGPDAGKRFNAAFLLGVSMVALEITLSGWISAYFEKYLKDGAFSVWGRNLQLSFWSMIVYTGIEIVQSIKDPETSAFRDFTQGWSATTLMLVLLGGGGGILVAFAIKFADAVMKSMATAFALVVVVTAEMFFLGAPVDPVVCLSSGIALLSLQAYNEAPKVVPPEPKDPERNPEARRYSPVPLGKGSDGG